ncbi:MAG: hypothetical protein QM723_34375 [Myxococcaceae bacterium]
MLTISTDDNGLLTAPGGRTQYVRVLVKDGGGAWRDLTVYCGFNAVNIVSWKESLDSPGHTADITLKREEDMLSLAPLVVTSALNLAFAYPGTFHPLLQKSNEIKIERAIVAGDKTPGPSDWTLAGGFHGYIDSVDWANDPIRISARGLHAKLMDTYIERERVYSYVTWDGVFGDGPPTGGVYIWTAGQLYQNDDYVIPTEANRNGFAYQNTSGVADNAGSVEPVWPVTPGADVIDGVSSSLDWVNCATTAPATGVAVEDIIKQILIDNGLSAVASAMSVPLSPGWMVKWFLQKRDSVWNAIKALADQIGWDLRFRYSAGAGDYVLTLTQPNRSVSTPDRTFAPSEYGDPTKFEDNVDSIRNRVGGWYSDSADLDPTGIPKRKYREVQDTPSITKYGVRFMEVAEDSASNIDTATEMDTMINAILADLKDPPVAGEVPVLFFPFVQLGDYYRFTADGKRTSGNLDSAVMGYEHSFDPSAQTFGVTTFTHRGQPAAQSDGWLNHDGRVNSRDVHQENLLTSDGIHVIATPIIGGTQLTATSTSKNKKGLPTNVEYHIGTTSGFTPGPSTLVGSGQHESITVPHKTPGQVLYAKVVPVGWNSERPVRGQPSQPVAFTAGQAAAAHLSSIPDLSRLPLNGGFETTFDPTLPPDHWSVVTGTWGTNISLVTGSGGISGDSYIRFSDVAVSRSMDSDIFVVEQGSMYEMSCWFNEHNIAINGQLVLTWLDSSKASISTVTLPSDGNALATWTQYFSASFAPSTARFAKLSVQTVSGANAHGFDVDLIQFRKLHLTGTLMFGANAFPNAAGTTFMNPGGPVAANQAAALGILLPFHTGNRTYLSGFVIRATTAPTNMSYAFSDPNGPLSFTWTGGAGSGDNTTIRQVKPLPINTGNALDIRVVATVTGGSPTGGRTSSPLTEFGTESERTDVHAALLRHSRRNGRHDHDER